MFVIASDRRECTSLVFAIASDGVPLERRARSNPASLPEIASGFALAMTDHFQYEELYLSVIEKLR
jgi:hypothetical protein